MPQFRKRPVVIEAIQITDANLSALFAMVDGPTYPSASGSAVRVLCNTTPDGAVTNHVHSVEIDTLEGTMIGRPGDWIITGVNGERYPCKSDIFEQTYEAV